MKDVPHHRHLRFSKFATLFLLALPFSIWGQANAPDKPAEKDTLLFTNGEKLVGKLQRSTGTSVVFHSDMAGDVTVDWSKVQELHSARRFAVVPKGVDVEKKGSFDKVVEGTVSMQDKKLEVTQSGGPAPVILPISATSDVIDATTFDNVVLHRPAWYQKWAGSATVGLSLVNATQTSQNYTSAISLVRAIPGESWMDPENRTSFKFNSSYGKLTQPNTPDVKTSIFHGEAERDHYLSPRLFCLGKQALIMITPRAWIWNRLTARAWAGQYGRAPIPSWM